jgi:elongation factor G
MNVYDSSRIRNIILLGHAGSGKTTLAETMLFEAGAISRRGSITEHNMVADSHPIEKEKEKSVHASFMHLEWRGYKINLIDTPGTTDYVGEVIGGLKVAGTSIFVLDAERGVEVGTELLWRLANENGTIPIFVVNKADHPKADFDKTVAAAQERFGREVVPVQYPYNQGADFNAIIDVLKMTMYEFPAGGGKPAKLPIPESQRARAELMHQQLVELIAENDEALMDHYFEKGNLDEEEMIEGLHRAMVKRQVFPLFCVSADRNMGTGRVMGFIDAVAPTPLEVPGPLLMDGREHTLDPSGKTALFIFKTYAEEHVGELMSFKVYNGSVKAGQDLVNNAGNTARFASIYVSQGGKRVDVTELKAGDIGAAVKLKDAGVNDTYHEKGFALAIAPIAYPEPTMRVAVKSLKTGEEEKLGSAVHQLHREDPSLTVENSQELRQLILGGQGEEHLAVVKHALTTRFKLSVEFGEPRVPYRETITMAKKSTYRHKKQTGGAGQYAEVFLLVEPWTEGMAPPGEMSVRDVQSIDLPWGGKLVYQNCIVGGVIDNRFIPAILKGVMEKMEQGPVSGSRIRDVRVSVYDGSMHPVDSNEAAFKTAGLMAFKQAFLEAGPQLLEPLYDLKICVPGDYTGDVMSDMSTRRGQIIGMEADGSMQVVKARAPLAEMSRYYTALKSMTQGRATFKMGFNSYAPVPYDAQQKIMRETAAAEVG